MNVAQARRLVLLLEELTHPVNDPFGCRYDADECAAAHVTVRGCERAQGLDVLNVDFTVPRPSSRWLDVVDGASYRHGHACELGLTARGVLVTWSTVRIARGEWDAEMVAEAEARERHDDTPPVFEMECWRRVAVRWRPHAVDGRSAMSWVFAVEQGSWVVDPLLEFRQARDAVAVKAAA